MQAFGFWNLYVALMDFGLDKFIEMFEARFGKKATTALLILIGAGIASAMVNLIVRDLIIPLYDVILGLIDLGAFGRVVKLAQSITKSQLIAGIVEVFITVGCSAIYYEKVKQSAINSVKKLVMDDPQKFMEMLSERIHAEVDKIIAAQVESPLSPTPQVPPTETLPQKSRD